MEGKGLLKEPWSLHHHRRQDSIHQGCEQPHLLRPALSWTRWPPEVPPNLSYSMMSIQRKSPVQAVFKTIYPAYDKQFQSVLWIWNFALHIELKTSKLTSTISERFLPILCHILWFLINHISDFVWMCFTIMSCTFWGSHDPDVIYLITMTIAITQIAEIKQKQKPSVCLQVFLFAYNWSLFSLLKRWLFWAVNESKTSLVVGIIWKDATIIINQWLLVKASNGPLLGASLAVPEHK